MLNMKFLKIGRGKEKDEEGRKKEKENVRSGRSQKSIYLTAFLIHNGTSLFQRDF